MNVESKNELLLQGLEVARCEPAPPGLWDRIAVEAHERAEGRPATRRALPRRWTALVKIAAGLIGLLGWLAVARGIDASSETRPLTRPETPGGLRPTPLDFLTRHASLESDPLELDDIPEVHLLAQILESREVRR